MIKKVYTATNLPKAEHTCHGNPIQIQYVKAYDEAGVPYLKETGKINTDEMIASQLPPNPAEILQRALQGDLSLIDANGNGVYADVSGFGDLGKMMQINKETMDLIDNYYNAVNVENNANTSEIQDVKTDEKKEGVTE